MHVCVEGGSQSGAAGRAGIAVPALLNHPSWTVHGTQVMSNDLDIVQGPTRRKRRKEEGA